MLVVNKHVETLQQLRTTMLTTMMTDSRCCFIQTEIGKTEGSSWWSLVSVLLSAMLMGVHKLNLAKRQHLLVGERGGEWQRWQVHNEDAVFVASVWNSSYQIIWESADCRCKYSSRTLSTLSSSEFLDDCNINMTVNKISWAQCYVCIVQAHCYVRMTNHEQKHILYLYAMSNAQNNYLTV